ncbi:DUF4913 domain-containing protein [Nocardia wallacei]|uniref:DUF4913 domain-containing protein n=1 Tax=Nocardia wallacei TaxID=480035 RepID=UPI002454B7D1|nr:DUF4913 domain-containing protein [Nocardia wallacei]
MSTTTTDHAQTEAAAAATEYESLGAFLRDRLSEVYARQVTDHSDTVWCPEWWRHPEAHERLWIVWQTYEELAPTGGVGLSDWWQLHCEPHLSRLMSLRGPFKYCSIRNGHKDMLRPLPFFLDAAPKSLFTPQYPAAPIAAA